MSRITSFTARTASAALVGAALVTVGATAPTAGATGPDTSPRACGVESKVLKTPSRGRVVWLPTSLAAGPYQRGGTQSVAYADGELTSKTSGSSDSVGGEAGASFGIGSASATYNHTWSRSTTATTSKTRTFTTTSDPLPANKRARWTLYHKGYKFPTRLIVTYTNSCPTKVFHNSVVVPTRSWSQANLSWETQLASKPRALHY